MSMKPKVIKEDDLVTFHMTGEFIFASPGAQYSGFAGKGGVR